jgi:hypothetical protein
MRLDNIIACILILIAMLIATGIDSLGDLLLALLR